MCHSDLMDCNCLISNRMNDSIVMSDCTLESRITIMPLIENVPVITIKLIIHYQTKITRTEMYRVITSTPAAATAEYLQQEKKTKQANLANTQDPEPHVRCPPCSLNSHLTSAHIPDVSSDHPTYFDGARPLCRPF